MIFRKPVFWITASILFIGGLFYSAQVFPKAFAILNVDLKMDRESAFSQSNTLAEKIIGGQIIILNTVSEYKFYYI